MDEKFDFPRRLFQDGALNHLPKMVNQRRQLVAAATAGVDGILRPLRRYYRLPDCPGLRLGL